MSPQKRGVEPICCPPSEPLCVPKNIPYPRCDITHATAYYTQWVYIRKESITIAGVHLIIYKGNNSRRRI